MKIIKNKKTKGETITEVMISTVMFVMVISAVFLVLKDALSTNINVKNRVMALSIAREGIEAVRNIRDTNWLKYSGKRRDKWLCHDQVGDDTCARASDLSGKLLDDGDYTVDFSEDNKRYYLGKAPSSYALHLENTGRFTHTSSLTTTPTPFSRTIKLEIENPLPGVSFCTGTCEKAVLHIISKVDWMEGENLRSETLEAYLYDYYDRTKY